MNEHARNPRRPSVADAMRHADAAEAAAIHGLAAVGGALETAFGNFGQSPGPAKIQEDPPAEPAALGLDETLADAIECVARQRARLGRKVCSPRDAARVREIWTALRALEPAARGSAADPAWGPS